MWFHHLDHTISFGWSPDTRPYRGQEQTNEMTIDFEIRKLYQKLNPRMASIDIYELGSYGFVLVVDIPRQYELARHACQHADVMKVCVQIVGGHSGGGWITVLLCDDSVALHNFKFKLRNRPSNARFRFLMPPPSLARALNAARILRTIKPAPKQHLNWLSIYLHGDIDDQYYYPGCRGYYVFRKHLGVLDYVWG